MVLLSFAREPANVNHSSFSLLTSVAVETGLAGEKASSQKLCLGFGNWELAFSSSFEKCPRRRVKARAAAR
jgi:hypothetical protein